MYIVTKTFYFSASHALYEIHNSDEYNMHGHNYTVRVEIRSSYVVKNGLLFSDDETNEIKNWIKDELHKKHLNDIFGIMPTTNENLCHWLYHKFKLMIPSISAVEVSDEPGNICRYE